MTSAQVVETSVKVTTNSPSQDYTHPDDHNLRTYDMTPGFKPFTKTILLARLEEHPSGFRLNIAKVKQTLVLWPSTKDINSTMNQSESMQINVAVAGRGKHIEITFKHVTDGSLIGSSMNEKVELELLFIKLTV